jgi:hypothetical protein
MEVETKEAHCPEDHIDYQHGKQWTMDYPGFKE